MKPRIGFVGTGRMGANMAHRLHDCGFPITALYDIDSNVAQDVAQVLGAAAYTHLADVTANADIIFTVVSDDAAMHAIYQTPDNNLFQNAAGKLFINCATITPDVHILLMQAAERIGAKMLECPMASSIPQARAGTLYLMCAGEKSVFEKAHPVLEALSTTVIYTGAPGTASKIKALVNMVMNNNTAALAEGLGLADALGLDLDMVRQIFSQTGANSRVLETDGEDMQNRDHATYFSAAHAAKDSSIALALATSTGVSTPVTAATRAMYDEMVNLGLGHLDKSGISELTFKTRYLNHAADLVNTNSSN